VTPVAGIADSNTIDVVAQDASGRYMMVMVETRPWGTDPEQPTQLREKINAYAGFILDGSLHRHYPETAGQPVDIRLDCPDVPTGEIAEIAQFAAAELTKLGIGFRVNLLR
jgi:hypothetical protein